LEGHSFAVAESRAPENFANVSVKWYILTLFNEQKQVILLFG